MKESEEFPTSRQTNASRWGRGWPWVVGAKNGTALQVDAAAHLGSLFHRCPIPVPFWCPTLGMDVCGLSGGIAAVMALLHPPVFQEGLGLQA